MTVLKCKHYLIHLTTLFAHFWTLLETVNLINCNNFSALGDLWWPVIVRVSFNIISIEWVKMSFDISELHTTLTGQLRRKSFLIDGDGRCVHGISIPHIYYSHPSSHQKATGNQRVYIRKSLVLRGLNQSAVVCVAVVAVGTHTKQWSHRHFYPQKLIYGNTAFLFDMFMPHF